MTSEGEEGRVKVHKLSVQHAVGFMTALSPLSSFGILVFGLAINKLGTPPLSDSSVSVATNPQACSQLFNSVQQSRPIQHVLARQFICSF